VRDCYMKNVARKKRRGFLIGEKLAQLLRLKGLSQYKLSQLTGIPQPVISDYIRNRHGVSYENLEKISKALNVPISYFFEEESKEKPQQLSEEELIKEIEELLKRLPPEKKKRALKAIKEQLELMAV